MGLSAKLVIAVKNPDYTGLGCGHTSTLIVEKTLDHDPLFKHLKKVPVNFDVPGVGVTTLVCEVRDKNYTCHPEIGGGETVAIYQMSPFGIEQEDGEVYS